MKQIKNTLIKLTEVTKTSDDNNPTKESAALVNAEAIVSANMNEMPIRETVIIGQKRTMELTFIQLTTGRGIYVKDTLDEVLAKVEAVYAAA